MGAATQHSTLNKFFRMASLSFLVSSSSVQLAMCWRTFLEVLPNTGWGGLSRLQELPGLVDETVNSLAISASSRLTLTESRHKTQTAGPRDPQSRSAGSLLGQGLLPSSSSDGSQAEDGCLEGPWIQWAPTSTTPPGEQ